ncbi:hypothetical protein [Pseudomonas baetica]|uniref:hypothetical protein n=1 Tax=Pseudomonas baetica TaxID=674054 RepID=UPI00240743C7|nr:hypothetical protein [Pseudomonas baetica]MDF9779055.1 hypothetical protein [Pseudomonas baetica]
MTDLQTIQKFAHTCHVFNAGDAATRTNVCTLIIPALRRYRREMVAALAFARQSAIKLSYADILAQNRSIRSAIVAAELRLNGVHTSHTSPGYDIDGEFDEFGAFDVTGH